MTAFDVLVLVSGIGVLVLLVRMKSPSPLYDLAAAGLGNVTPIVGVLYYDWQLFPILFLFWLETVVLIPLTCVRSHSGWFFGGIAAFFCLIHLLFMFVLTGPAAHIETTAALLDESWLLPWAVAAVIFEHGYGYLHEKSRPQVAAVNDSEGMHESLHKMAGLGLIARVAALQVTLLLGLYLVDVYHSTVPALLFFLFFKGLVDVFSWGFWLPATEPWSKLRKPMGVAMISTIASLPIWFPLGMFVLFSAAGNEAPADRANLTQDVDQSLHRNQTHSDPSQSPKEPTPEERRSNARQLAAQRLEQQRKKAAARVAKAAADEQKKKLETENRLREELEAIVARVGTVNRAQEATYRDLSGLNAEDFKRITDGDLSTSWKFTAHRTNPKFIPRGKGFKLIWQEPHTLNKITLRQDGDNLRSITIWYLPTDSNRWQQLCSTLWSFDPKNMTPFMFFERGSRRDRRDHLFFFNEHSLHEIPRSLGHSNTQGPVVLEAYFRQPITTKSLMINLNSFDGRPVSIQELGAY
jgi:hypothetical protein